MQILEFFVLICFLSFFLISNFQNWCLGPFHTIIQRISQIIRKRGLFLLFSRYGNKFASQIIKTKTNCIKKLNQSFNLSLSFSLKFISTLLYIEYILQLQSEYEKILNQRWSKNKPS